MHLLDIVLAAATVVAFVVGRVTGYYKRDHQDPKPPSYRCTCGDPISAHEHLVTSTRELLHGGPCQVTHQQRKWATNVDWHDVDVRCACQGYVGERPVELMERGYPA
jgi:hypothetical protein